MGVQGEEFGAKAATLWGSCADCELSRYPSSHPHHLWSFRQEVQNPVAGGGWDAKVCLLPDKLAWADGVEGRTVVLEEHPGICSAAFQVLQGVVKGYCYRVVH